MSYLGDRFLIVLCSVSIVTGLVLFIPQMPVAHASSITVDTLSDDNIVNGNCTLREAILAANTNTAVDGCTSGSPGVDTINFNVTGTIVLSIWLPQITEDLNVNGPSGALIISGNGLVPSGFATNPNITLNINHLTFDGGSGGAFAIGSGSRVSIVNNTFSNNVGSYGAGAIYVSSNTTLNVANSTFFSNTVLSTAYNGGGGAIESSGIVAIADSSFYNNYCIWIRRRWWSNSKRWNFDHNE